MSMISTYARISTQQTLNATMQKQLATLSAENSSGKYQDIPATLGSKVTLLYSLQAQSAQQTASQQAATLVGGKLDTMQTAMTSINTLAGTMTTYALQANANTGSQGLLNQTTAIQARAGMDQLLNTLNTSYNGNYIFSGNDSGTPPVAKSSGDGITSALDGLVSSAVSANGGSPLDSTTVANLQTSIDKMFSDTNTGSDPNFSGTVFKATDDGKPVTFSVGGTQSVSYDLKGNAQGFRDTMHGMALMSILDAAGTQMDDGAKSALLTQATSLLNQGQTEMTAKAASIGAVQAQLTSISTAQTAAATTTQTKILNLVSVDPFKAATDLSTLQTQLSASYSVTAQIAKLSFVDFMK